MTSDSTLHPLCFHQIEASKSIPIGPPDRVLWRIIRAQSGSICLTEDWPEKDRTVRTTVFAHTTRVS